MARGNCSNVMAPACTLEASARVSSMDSDYRLPRNANGISAREGKIILSSAPIKESLKMASGTAMAEWFTAMVPNTKATSMQVNITVAAYL